MSRSRRDFLSGSSMTALGVLIASCKRGNSKGGADEVTATEDLMREHGVLRRALITYREASSRFRTDPASVPLDALRKTAGLFRSFGEDYHERKLEEAFIFPAVRGAGAEAAAYVDTLVAQHSRGREITSYILSVTQALGSNAQVLGTVLDMFARMYEEHMAIEDTVIFPAWKKTLSTDQLDEMGDRFEEIEKVTFGKDGFEDALRQMSEIEGALGLADLSDFTAAPPPHP